MVFGKVFPMVDRASRLERITPALGTLYLAFIISVLLYPFEFSLPSDPPENTVEWRTDTSGVQFGSSGILHSDAPPVILCRRLQSGVGLTIEVWLSSATADQRGPARIISYSLNPWERNFTLGQSGNDLVMRLRTTRTNNNGMKPSLNVPNVFVPETMQHIVVTYDFEEQRVYVDGKLREASTIPQGTFETWDPSYFLVFGNEFSGDRPWSGTITYAVIYDFPLPEKDVVTRYKAGLRFSGVSPHPSHILVYDFKRGLESLKRGTNTAQTVSPMPPLKRPKKIADESRLFFSLASDPEGKMIVPRHSSERLPTVRDLAEHFVLFVPVGFLVLAWVRRRVNSTALAFLITVVGVVLASAILETLQFFLEVRSSSFFDFSMNVLGAMAGAAGCWYWFLRRGELQQTSKPNP